MRFTELEALHFAIERSTSPRLPFLFRMLNGPRSSEARATAHSYLSAKNADLGAN